MKPRGKESVVSLAASVAAWSLTAVPSDEDIVRRVVAGEHALFEVLMRRNNQRLYRAIRSIVQAEVDAEDVMQQTYVQAYGALSGFGHASKFSTWLIRIGINAALVSGRTASRFVALPDPPSNEEEPLASLTSPQPTPEDSTNSAELSRLLERVLDALPQMYRTVLMLREVEGLSTEETATALAVSEDVVKTRLRRAKLLARATLERWTSHHAEHAFQFHAPRCDRVVAFVLEAIREPSQPS
jgi:RNA polymerase sigma-70 factor (ECF subfamily)